MANNVRIAAVLGAAACAVAFSLGAGQARAATPTQQRATARQVTLQIRQGTPAPLSSQGGPACSQLSRFTAPAVPASNAITGTSTRTVVEVPFGAFTSGQPLAQIGSATQRAQFAEACRHP